MWQDHEQHRGRGAPDPKRQVEWIDELVFPEGFEGALKGQEKNIAEDNHHESVIAESGSLQDKYRKPRLKGGLLRNEMSGGTM